jgi:glutamyl-tRNA synthetase
VRNFLCLLGWNPKDDREVLDINEVIRLFDLKDVQTGNARFDERKMLHINSEYLRALPPETFAWEARGVLAEAGLDMDGVPEDYLQAAMALCQPKVSGFEDLPGYARFFFATTSPATRRAGKRSARRATPWPAWRGPCPRWRPWNLERGALEAALQRPRGRARATTSPTRGSVVRMAVSGMSGGPELIPVLAALGRERTLARLRRFGLEG